MAGSPAFVRRCSSPGAAGPARPPCQLTDPQDDPKPRSHEQQHSSTSSMFVLPCAPIAPITAAARRRPYPNNLHSSSLRPSRPAITLAGTPRGGIDHRAGVNSVAYPLALPSSPTQVRGVQHTVLARSPKAPRG